MLSKKQLELEDLENSKAAAHIAKSNEKACSGENTKDIAGQSLDKEIMGVIMELIHQLSRRYNRYMELC